MLGRLLLGGTFRLAAGYAIAVVVLLLLLAQWLWDVTAGFVEEHLDRLMSSESQVVIADVRGGRLDLLVGEINRSYRNRPVTRRVILLADSRYQPLAGNLPAWPQSVGGQAGWHELPVNLHPGVSDARVLHTLLPDGSHLLLGYDLKGYNAGRKSFLVLLAGISSPMIVAMLLLGWFVRRALLAHIAAINTTTSAIMRGSLKERLAERGSHSELTLLTRTINRMLDQIEELVASTANVSKSIAHDLRTPLAEARSRFDDLYTKLPADSAARLELAAGIGDIDRVIGMFESLLRLAQIESGERRSGFESMDLSSVVRSVVELYGSAAEDKHLKFDVDMPARLSMHGDPSLMAQAISNLVDNAIKYTQSGGHIKLTIAELDEAAIRISVSDSGPGICEEERPKVTTYFYRGEAGHSVAGTGLGLSLVAAIAKLHAGELLLQDNCPGLRATLALSKP